MNEQPGQFWTWRRVFIYTLIVGLTLFVIYKQELVLFIVTRVMQLVGTMLLAAAVAYLLNPVCNWMANARVPLNYKARRTGAALILVLLFLAVLALLVTLAATPIIQEVGVLVDLVQHWAKNFPQWLDQSLAMYHDSVPPALAQTIQTQATTWLGQVLQANYFGAAKWLVLRGWYLVDLLVIPVLAFHLLRDGRALRVGLVEYLPHAHRRMGGLILEDLHRILKRYVQGILILCVAFGAASTILLFLAGTRVYVVLGILAGLSWTVPIIGPAVVGIPLIGVTWAQAGFGAALLVLLVYIGLNVLWSKIIFPSVIGDAMKLHPITIILSVLLAGELLGPLGMLIAVPLAAICKAAYVRAQSAGTENVA